MAKQKQGVSERPPATASRRYDARGRRAQAMATRERILGCARELFVERGFAGVSVADVAAAAGVSAPTVFARFGSKVTLLKEAVDTAIVGDAEPIPFADRPEMRHVREGATAEEVITRFAHLVATLSPRVVPIAMVVYAAADADPNIAALARSLDAQRLTGAAALAGIILDKADGVTVRRAELADQLWLTNAPQTWDLLVQRRGWSARRYESWVARTITAALVPLGSSG